MAPKTKDAPEVKEPAVKEEQAEKAAEKVFSKEELLPIIDSLLNFGYVMTNFKIKNIPVVLKTRFGWEDQVILRRMKDADGSPMAFRREFTLWSMAAALVQFGSDKFEPMNDTDKPMEELELTLLARYNFMRSLNSIFIDIIELELAKFDDMQEYIVKNYQKLLEDF